MLNFNKFLKPKHGISLIVLVITIIILAILATAVIISISNSNIMVKAKYSVFKSDLQELKSSYNIWLADYITGKQQYDVYQLNYATKDSAFLNDIMKGKVSDRYKDGLGVENGRLIYETDDEKEQQIVIELNMAPSTYSITATLNHVVSSNVKQKAKANTSYQAILTPDSRIYVRRRNC